MSLYNLETMLLGTMIENYSYGSNLTQNEKIELARKKIFNFDYPTWTEEHKKRFETLFLRHFYFSEIGSETEGQFLFRLETWLQLNMEYYVKLLKSQLWEEQIKNPLQNYDLTEHSKTDRLDSETGNIETEGKNNELSTLNTTLNGTSETSANNEIDTNGSSYNFNRNIEGDTPQDRLELTTKDGSGVIEYASKINEVLDDQTTSENSKGKQDAKTTDKTTNDTTNNSQTTIENETKTSKTQAEKISNELTRVGNIGIMTYDQLLNGYRTIFMQIERDIFEAMKSELFMLVY